jgi:hypothetical protein
MRPAAYAAYAGRDLRRAHYSGHVAETAAGRSRRTPQSSKPGRFPLPDLPAPQCSKTRTANRTSPNRNSKPGTTELPRTADRAGFRCRTSRLPRAQIQRVGTLRSRTAGAPIRVRGKAPQLSREGADLPHSPPRPLSARGGSQHSETVCGW